MDDTKDKEKTQEIQEDEHFNAFAPDPNKKPEIVKDDKKAGGGF